MHSGIYTAYSGLKAQMEALDSLANNLANVNTTGFKEQKSFFTALNLAIGSPDASPLDAAVNSAVSVQNSLNPAYGNVIETHRDLDVALIGDGFLTIETPAGIRYTRNGHLTTNKQSVLCTLEGFPVLGERGKITLGPGKVDINQNGEVTVDGTPVDRLKLASFERPGALLCEGSSLLVPKDQVPKPAADVAVRQGFQEQSNVNPVLATVKLLEIMRHFEAIQKSISLIFNEMDAKAIERLPR